MSLLNDALRKKNREKLPAVDPALGLPSPVGASRKRKRQYWFAGISFGLLLAIGLVIGLMIHSVASPSASMLSPSTEMGTPLSPATAPPASPHASTTARTSAKTNLPENVAPASSEEISGPDPIKKTTVAAIEPKGHPSPASAKATPSPMKRSPGLLAPPAVPSKKFRPPVTETSSVLEAQPKANRPDRLTESVQVDRYYRKALSYHRQGRLPRAIALYREALQRQPAHVDARFNLVSAYIDMHEYAKAHHIAAALYHEDETNPQFLINLAIAKIGLGQFREALTLLEHVSVSAGASMFTVYLHKGIACRGLDQLGTAIEWYRRAEALNPDHPQLLFNLALASDRRQNYDQALHYYQAYLGLTADARAEELKNIRQRMATLRLYLAAATSPEQTKP